MKRFFVVSFIFLAASVNLFSVPSHPLKQENYPKIFSGSSEIFSRQNRNGNMPDSILVLMVDFEDHEFDLIADYPDSLAHDKVYFERFMFHLSSFYHDASHGNYSLQPENYTVWENIITAPNTMAYYGDDDLSLERITEFAQDVFEIADAEIDFNNYDSFMIFHAGAGQEADVNEVNLDELMSTFLNRRTLQAGLDPENDDFPGLITDDGKIIKEIVICPETEWQPDFEEGDPNYGMIGIIAFLWGRQIGLATLFDNDSSNGVSYGIGNFGVMGTGAWNANGYVPPLPCAWSRYYMGWEEENIEEISVSESNLFITFPMANDEITKKIFKIVISDKEYFLLENRQQNPDGSTLQGEPSFTFALLPEGEQDVYPPGHPHAGEPRFNFMENTYKGCEWDFYMPGLGAYDGNVIDGSGLFIWHIDENIIDEKFNAELETNSVNSDASHKGVDLEEADGIQHMDSTVDINSLGSAYDAYREGNNDYFGGRNNPFNGFTSNPTAESYYGGIQLEIYDISSSDSLMTFSVRYPWSLDGDFDGENPFPVTLVDFDNDGRNEIFYPMPDGKINVWKDNDLLDGFPIWLSLSVNLTEFYSYDENNNSFLLPCTTPNGLFPVLYEINFNLPDFQNTLFIETNKTWAGSVIINPDQNSQKRAFAPLNHIDSFESEIKILDENYEQVNIINFSETKIASNLLLKNNFLYSINQDESFLFRLQKIALENNDIFSLDLDVLNDVTNDSLQILSALLADIDIDNLDEIIITTSDTLIYVFKQNGEILNNFPVKIPLATISIPSIADVDANGFLDILIGGENGFVVIEMNGVISKPKNEIASPDSNYITAGILAFDIDADNELEIIGNLSRNRFCVWENINNNNFEIKLNYPVSFSDRSLTYPIFASYADSANYEEENYFFISGNNGTLFRYSAPDNENIEQPVWFSEFANLQRTASYLGELPVDPYENRGIFIKENTYFYPNPLSNIFDSSIYKGEVQNKTITLKIMTSVNTEVKVKIFDIAGNRIFNKMVFCEKNMETGVFIDADELSSGVYFSIIKAKGEILKKKFAIEK